MVLDAEFHIGVDPAKRVGAFRCRRVRDDEAISVQACLVLDAPAVRLQESGEGRDFWCPVRLGGNPSPELDQVPDRRGQGEFNVGVGTVVDE